MSTDLSNYRKSYEKDSLRKKDVAAKPMDQFEKWFKEVEEVGGSHEVNAMTISTLGEDGFPLSRVVLLKKFDDNGFVFFTNYGSQKGQAIEKNPGVCISFFWPSLERQVIIKGYAEKTSQEISTEYFHSRPHGSQLGAVVSQQSQILEDRSEIEEELISLKAKYENKEVPKPENWGGYLVKPESIEFWQGRPNRLHDRIRYKKQEKNWKIERLAP